MNSFSTGDEIRCLTGLRGYLALIVTVFHYWPPLTGKGYLAVDVFFVLSGYVLGHVYAERFSKANDPFNIYGRYLWRRVARVYPVHLAALAASIPIIAGLYRLMPALFAQPQHLDSIGIPTALLLVHSFGFQDYSEWNGPSWSLSAEFFAYLLLLPLLALRPSYWKTVSIVVAGILLLQGGLMIKGLESVRTLLHDGGFLRVLPCFAAGFLCWQCRAAHEAVPSSLHSAFCTVTAIILLLLLPERGEVLVCLPAALLIYGLSSDNLHAAIVFGNRYAVAMGRMSYSLYMTHLLWFYPFSYVMVTLSLNAHAGVYVVASVLCLAFAVLVAAAVYRFIERPARRALLKM